MRNQVKSGSNLYMNSVKSRAEPPFHYDYLGIYLNLEPHCLRKLLDGNLHSAGSSAPLRIPKK